MKARAAAALAWKRYREHPGDMLAFLLLEVILRAMALTPLLFLTDSGLRFLAWLCVPLWVLIVLPARQAAAAVMQDCVRGGRLFSRRLVDLRLYRKHLIRGLQTLLLMLPWAVPLGTAGFLLVQFYRGQSTLIQGDFMTLLVKVRELGGGDFVRGVTYVLLILALMILLVLIGLAFHSGRRHEAALGGKRVVPGHRWTVIRAWLLGLLVLVPFAVVTLLAARGWLHSAMAAIKKMSALPPLSDNLYLILAAAVVLVLPLIPLKSMITACAVHGLWEGKE